MRWPAGTDTRWGDGLETKWPFGEEIRWGNVTPSTYCILARAGEENWTLPADAGMVEAPFTTMIGGQASGWFWSEGLVDDFGPSPTVSEFFEFVPADGDTPPFVRVKKKGTYLVRFWAEAVGAADDLYANVIAYPYGGSDSETSRWVISGHGAWFPFDARRQDGTTRAAICEGIVTVAGDLDATQGITAAVVNKSLSSRVINSNQMQLHIWPMTLGGVPY